MHWFVELVGRRCCKLRIAPGIGFGIVPHNPLKTMRVPKEYDIIGEKIAHQVEEEKFMSAGLDELDEEDDVVFNQAALDLAGQRHHHAQMELQKEADKKALERRHRSRTASNATPRKKQFGGARKV